jgi:hypothetical protein
MDLKLSPAERQKVLDRLHATWQGPGEWPAAALAQHEQRALSVATYEKFLGPIPYPVWRNKGALELVQKALASGKPVEGWAEFHKHLLEEAKNPRKDRLTQY